MTLPQSWHLVPLGDLVAPTRPKHKPLNYPDLPFIGMEHVEADSMRLLGTVKAGTMKSSAVHFQPGDVLYGRLRPYLNKVYRPNFEGLCSAEFIVLPTTDQLDSGYLQYFLNSAPFVRFASHLKAGDRPRVDFEQLRTYPVPVPAIDEQRRIVRAIEEQFSRLDSGSANVQAAIRRLGKYRRSLLHSACSGRLLLSESTGTGPRINTGLPEGWSSARLGDLASVGSGATPLRSRRDYYEGGTIAWVTSSQLHQEYVRSPTELITSKALKECGVKLWPVGTLLVAMYGEGRTRGKCSELAMPACTNQACAAIVFRPEQVDLRPWVKLFLLASYEANRSLASGGVQPNLNLGLIKGLQVPLPPPRERARIVSEVQRLLSIVGALEDLLESALERSVLLRRQVLAAAFTGELVVRTRPTQTRAVTTSRIGSTAALVAE